MRMKRATFLIIALLAGRPGAAAAQDVWKAAHTWTCGTQSDAWVVAEGQARGAALPIIQMWHAGIKNPSGLPEQKPFLPAITGRILETAADSAALHVLFTDLSTGDYFSQRSWSAGSSWKEHCLQHPLTWGADVSDPVLYAVVRTRALLPITTSPADAEADSGEVSSKGREIHERAPAEPASDAPGITLMMMQLGAWRRVPGPSAAADADEFWITGRDAQAVLFWRTNRDILYSVYSGSWSEPRGVCIVKDLQRAWAACTPQGPLWIAALGDSADGANIHPYILKDGVWQDLGSAREGSGEILAVNVRECSISVARGKLAVSRCGADGSVEFGYGELGPTPLVRFSTLALRQPETGLDQQWQDSIVLAILLGIMTLVMWTRRTEIASQIVLPQGLAFSAVWKRVLAAGVDLIPALLVVAPWWWPKLNAMRDELSALSGEQLAAALSTALHLEFYFVFFAHGVWCFIFESTLATTPGKMLSGLRVYSTDGTRPNIRQCLIRNATRSIMLSLGSSGLIVTLMTIIVVSRNRQRVGDLLARTIVLEPSPMIVEESNPPE
jgi:uncharacterized RDD family membrane protein YckC